MGFAELLLRHHAAERDWSLYSLGPGTPGDVANENSGLNMEPW